MSKVEMEISPKEQLIETGIRLFAELNGHEVSNRRLAREANVNHAMINYHFGSRDGLCDAIFNRALGKWAEALSPILKQADTAIDSATCEADLESVARRLVSDILLAVTGEKSSQFLAVLLNDDLTTPQRYYDRVFDEVLAPFHTLAAKLAARSIGYPEDSMECYVVGQTIVAQCMTFFRGRILLLRKAGPVLDEKSKAEAIIRVVSDSVVATLGFRSV